MYTIKGILKESMPVLVLAAAISIAAGFILNGQEEMLHSLPGLLIVVPPFINMGGDMASVLSSRLSSALHLGLIHPRFKKDEVLDKNIMATYITAVVSFTLLGFLAWGFNQAFGFKGLGPLKFPLVTLTAGFFTILMLSLLAVAGTYLSYRKGIDPDNSMIPLLATMGDIIGISALFFMVSMVL